MSGNRELIERARKEAEFAGETDPLVLRDVTLEVCNALEAATSESPHVEAKHWGQLTKSRARVKALEADRDAARHALDEARWKLAQIRDATTWAEKPAVIVAAIAEIVGDARHARLFTRDEVEEMVEDTTDRLGNLYRIDFLNRLEHEASLESEPTA